MSITFFNLKGGVMVSVNVSNYDSFDKALRIFRVKVRRSQIMKIVHRKAHFISPSEKRHRLRQRKRS